MDNNQISQTYQNLAKLIFYLLGQEDLSLSEPAALQDQFLKGLYDLLKTTLDLTIEPEELITWLRSHSHQPNDLALAQFTAKTLEQPKTYIILNYYFKQFLEIYRKTVPEFKQNQFWQIVNQFDIDKELLIEVEQTYKKVIRQTGL